MEEILAVIFIIVYPRAAIFPNLISITGYISPALFKTAALLFIMPQ
jgi:hypothetical protein